MARKSGGAGEGLPAGQDEWPLIGQKRVLFKLWWSICRNVLKRLRRRRLMVPPDGSAPEGYGDCICGWDRCVNWEVN